MLRLNSSRFLHLVGQVHVAEGLSLPVGGLPEFSSLTVDKAMRDEATEICEAVRELQLPMSLVEAERFKKFYEAEKIKPADGRERIRALTSRIRDELESRHLLVLSQEEATFFDDELPFGKSAFDSFPSANEDIAEASKCLGLGRATACVMHLMRAIEVALKALGTNLGVSKQNDWGSYLRQIEAGLGTRIKASFGRPHVEQFYAEAAVCFDEMKFAWRNPTMHIERTYTTERASEIFTASKEFMKHLSAKIRE